MTDLTVRTAAAADAIAIHALIESHQADGHLLPRSLDDIRRRIAAFVVADVHGAIVGCAELVALSQRVAEIRSLVVASEWRGAGVAADIVGDVRQRAVARGFETLCAFTHDARFFVKQRFSIVPHLWVPEKMARDCVRCALFRHCGQHAMISPLRDVVRHARPTIEPAVAVA